MMFQFFFIENQYLNNIDTEVGSAKEITIRDKPILNREYISFVLWSEMVYGCSYPEYIESLMSFEDENFGTYNYECDYFGEIESKKYTGIFENYIFNPKYLNYPITGISDFQLNEFLKWASDRYNENRLMKKKYLKFNDVQKDEDCFVLESYLVEQYYGDRIKENTASNYKKIKYTPTFRMPFQEELSLIKSENKFEEYKFDKKDFLWEWDSKIIGEQTEDGFLQVLNYSFQEKIRLPYSDESLIKFDSSYKNKLSIVDKKMKYSNLSYLGLDAKSIDSYKQKDKYGRMSFEIISFEKNNKIIVANRNDYKNTKPSDYFIYRMVANKRMEEEFLP